MPMPMPQRLPMPLHPTGTSGIAGSYLNISYALLPSTFGLYSTVRFFAAYGAATWDASVICYSIKYLKPFWRPITAIR